MGLAFFLGYWTTGCHVPDTPTGKIGARPGRASRELPKTRL